MNVVVLGPGAVGSFLAWALAAGGHAVSLVGRRRSGPAAAPAGGRASALPAAGAEPGVLGVVDPSGRRHEAPVRHARGLAAVPVEPDLVVVAVKAFDVPAAVASLPAWPLALVLTVQNGIGAEEGAVAARPTGRLVAGSLTASVSRDRDGVVRWLRRGGIGLAGVQRADDAAVAQLSAAFRASGLPARPYPDWATMKWSKLLANLVGNATSALLDRDPAAVYRDPPTFAIERAQLREALAVMRAAGRRPVALPGAPVPGLALAVALPAPLGRLVLARVVRGARGGKAPSLRDHLAAASGPSEVGWLNGAVAREGERLGVPTPVNAALTRLVDGAVEDPELRAFLRHRSDRLAAALAAPGSVAGSSETEGAHPAPREWRQEGGPGRAAARPDAPDPDATDGVVPPRAPAGEYPPADGS